MFNQSSHFELLLRKQLYPAGPKSYPTLAQKHFNGAVALTLYLRSVFFVFCIYFCSHVPPAICFPFDGAPSKEAVVLAKWLESVTIRVAEQKPDDEHAQLLCQNCLPLLFYNCDVFGVEFFLNH